MNYRNDFACRNDLSPMICLFGDTAVLERLRDFSSHICDFGGRPGRIISIEKMFAFVIFEKRRFKGMQWKISIA
jgi:hypothetical protein